MGCSEYYDAMLLQHSILVVLGTVIREVPTYLTNATTLIGVLTPLLFSSMIIHEDPEESSSGFSCCFFIIFINHLTLNVC